MARKNPPVQYFPYRYDPRLAPFWLPFRVWLATQGVTVTEHRITAQYERLCKAGVAASAAGGGSALNSDTELLSGRLKDAVR